MKQIKITLSVILILAMLLPCILTVNATSTDYPISTTDRNTLISMLSDIELEKNLWGLSMVNFSEIRIGKMIHQYAYIDEGFEYIGGMYPLIFDGAVILWAVPTESHYQIIQGLTAEINHLVALNTPFALIYDTDSVYALTKSERIFLANSNIESAERSKLLPSTKINANTIIKNALTESSILGCVPSMLSQRGTSTYRSCDVTYVTQIPYANLCWAASAACVIRYKKGTSATAASIAQSVYGDTNFDKGLANAALVDIIRPHGLAYFYGAIKNSAGQTVLNYNSIIGESIRNDYPVFGSFSISGSSGSHCTVIYGINVISGYIRVMDPEFGMAYVNQTASGYRYVSSYSGKTLTLSAISFPESV